MSKRAAFAGLGLIGRAPFSFLAWIGIRAVEQYVTLAILLAAPGDVGSVWAALAQLAFEAVLFSAVLRGLLKPGANRFAWLRLGRIEFKMIGLFLLAFLAGLIVALPVAVAVAYVAYALKFKVLARSALLIGSAAAGVALMRFAPAPAILVDEEQIDLAGAWRASRGRYGFLVVVVLGAVALQNLLVMVPLFEGPPPELAGWSSLLLPVRFVGLAWGSLIRMTMVVIIAGAVATVWRASKQTLS